MKLNTALINSYETERKSGTGSSEKYSKCVTNINSRGQHGDKNRGDSHEVLQLLVLLQLLLLQLVIVRHELLPLQLQALIQTGGEPHTVEEVNSMLIPLHLNSP